MKILTPAALCTMLTTCDLWSDAVPTGCAILVTILVLLTNSTGFFFAVRSTNIEYFKPAQLSDLLTVTVDLQQLRHASLCVDQNIYRNDELLCEGSIRLAALKADTLDPTPIPEPLIADIKRWKTP